MSARDPRPYAEHLEDTLEELTILLDRTRDRVRFRAGEERTLSPEVRAKLKELSGLILAASRAVEIEATAPGSPEELEAIHRQIIEDMTRFQGARPT